MKIICVDKNYAREDVEPEHKQLYTEPVISLKPDSALLKDGKPFFIPDFSADIVYATELVVRICRLGKNIAARFAYRYYDSVTIGVDFTAADLKRKASELGNPWDVSKGFDCSAAIGKFVPLQQMQGNEYLHFHLDVDGKTTQQGNTMNMRSQIDDVISYVSQFMTLKIGDLIFTGTPAGAGQAVIGQHLEGYLEQQKLLDFYIK